MWPRTLKPGTHSSHSLLLFLRLMHLCVNHLLAALSLLPLLLEMTPHPTGGGLKPGSFCRLCSMKFRQCVVVSSLLMQLHLMMVLLPSALTILQPIRLFHVKDVHWPHLDQYAALVYVVHQCTTLAHRALLSTALSHAVVVCNMDRFDVVSPWRHTPNPGAAVLHFVS